MSINLSPLTDCNQEQVRRLVTTFTETKNEQLQIVDKISKVPLRRHASILVVLFQNSRTQTLDVLLTTRDRKLRLHGGHTAFPGGKADENDGGCWIWTAYREAYEETYLPFPVSHNVHPLFWPTDICTCPASTSRPTNRYAELTTTASLYTLGVLEPQTFGPLIVLPVVALLLPKKSDQFFSSLKGGEGEVEAIFSVPLERFLGGKQQAKWFEFRENIIWRVASGEDILVKDTPESEEMKEEDGSVGILNPILEFGVDGWVDCDGHRYHHHKVFPVPKLGPGAMYKAHSFQTCPKAGVGPVTGMSADVLITLASKTFGRDPFFDVHTTGQVIGFESLVSRYEEERERSREREQKFD